MSLKFLIDENIRSNALWSAICDHNRKSETPIDAIRVGDAGAPGYETTDPELLAWAAENGRIVVSQDYATLPRHLAEFVEVGNHSPGILFVPSGRTLEDLIDVLAVICHCASPEELADSCTWLPR